MRAFQCPCEAHQTLCFDSRECPVCERFVGFCPDVLDMRAFEPEAGGVWKAFGDPAGRYRPCRNRTEHGICNWMVQESDRERLCLSCRLTEVIPDLSMPESLRYWGRLEAAKRRVLYAVTALGLPLSAGNAKAALCLRFRFLADRDAETEFTEPLPNHPPVYTGHEAGLITVNLAEADYIALTRARVTLGERYRTLLGHFRHEIGHFYWDMLIAHNPTRLRHFRDLFGDERQDYDAARQAHYDQLGGDVGSPTTISEYASMHPWEDWAETWAHYLHMIDSLETAAAHSVALGARRYGDLMLPQAARCFGGASELISAWMELTVMLNSLNRSLGLRDAYPFELTDPVRDKLAWVHQVIRDHVHSPGAREASLRAS